MAPIAIRIPGVMRLLSNAYLTKKTTPRKNAKPPIQAKSLTPRSDSQFGATERDVGNGGEGGPADGNGRADEALDVTALGGTEGGANDGAGTAAPAAGVVLRRSERRACASAPQFHAAADE